MSQFFGYINDVDSQNKSRQSDLDLEKFCITQFGWIQLCTIVAMGMTITNLWKLFFVVLRNITMTNWLVLDNSQNDLLFIASIIKFQLILLPQKITYLSLINLIMERQFILAVHFIFPVLLLVPQRSALFMTSLSTVLRYQPLLLWLLLFNLSIIL